MVDFECTKKSAPFNIGMIIERTSDLLYVFGTTTEELNGELYSIDAGARFRVEFKFVAHWRGHYRLSVNSREPSSARFLNFTENVASFTVDENVTYDGVVDVELQAELTRDITS